MVRMYSLVVLASVTACVDGVEAGVDPAEATVAERRDFAVEYDLVDHAELRDDVATLSAMRRTDLPDYLPGYLVGEESPFRSDIVMGADQRVRVTPTTGFPNRARARIVMSFSDGYVADCSGNLVASKYVLTAGHCIHSQDHGGWATSVSVFPGQDGSLKPFSATAIRLRTTVAWADDEDDDEDYALLTLNTAVGNQTGWYGMVHYSDDFLDGEPNIQIGGYPADKAWGTQWQETGPILAYTDNHYFYDIDTYGGQSGSGATRIYNGDWCVTGVHHGTGYYWLSEYNMAVRITTARYNVIASWIASGT